MGNTTPQKSIACDIFSTLNSEIVPIPKDIKLSNGVVLSGLQNLINYVVEKENDEQILKEIEIELSTQPPIWYSRNGLDKVFLLSILKSPKLGRLMNVFFLSGKDLVDIFGKYSKRFVLISEVTEILKGSDVMSKITNHKKSFLKKVLRNINFWNNQNFEAWGDFFRVIEVWGSILKDNHDLLAELIYKNKSSIFNYYSLLSYKYYNPSRCCEWIKILYSETSCKYVANNYLHQLIKRDDRDLFLLDTYTSPRNHFGNEYIFFINHLDSLYPEETLVMLHKTDSNENTVVHYIAKKHDKKLLSFITTKFTNLNLKPNSDGKNVSVLYKESSLKTLKY